ncbi:unnamed protein product, partial [Rotaria sp. Silwood1]
SSMPATSLTAPREDIDADKILKEVGIHQPTPLSSSSPSTSPAHVHHYLFLVSLMMFDLVNLIVYVVV